MVRLDPDVQLSMADRAEVRTFMSGRLRTSWQLSPAFWPVVMTRGASAWAWVSGIDHGVAAPDTAWICIGSTFVGHNTA
jgi:hypothetical protein